MEDTYKTVKSESEGYFRDRGSKFISKMYNVNSVEEVKEKLDLLRKEYYDARHHCYAYSIGLEREVYRINDDGEPSGSSGKPIYGQFLSKDITNVLCVVIRYFGGTKLGIPGLINAYREATLDALSKNIIIEKIIIDTYTITFDYIKMNDVMKVLKDEQLKQTNHDYQEQCAISFEVRLKDSERIANLFVKLGKLEKK